MCGLSKTLLLFSLSLSLSAVAPLAEEPEAETWHLISGTELRAIETFIERSEAERLAWLSRARDLRLRAESLHSELASLNDLLAAQRERNTRLQQSFDVLERDWLTRVSSLSVENASLREDVQLIKGKANTRLVIIVALVSAIVLYMGFKAWRFFRPF